MTTHDLRVTLTEVLAAHVRLPMMHSQGCSCGWHASLSHPDLHRTHLDGWIEEHIEARLAPVRALADENEVARALYRHSGLREDLIDLCAAPFARVLRAALDAPVSASQDHDGAEGQGEREKAGEGRCGLPFGDGYDCDLPKGGDR